MLTPQINKNNQMCTNNQEPYNLLDHIFWQETLLLFLVVMRDKRDGCPREVA